MIPMVLKDLTNAYYQDLDGDGYGVLTTETLVCNSVKQLAMLMIRH